MSLEGLIVNLFSVILVELGFMFTQLNFIYLALYTERSWTQELFQQQREISIKEGNKHNRGKRSQGDDFDSKGSVPCLFL